jgi:hypothetical protein
MMCQLKKLQIERRSLWLCLLGGLLMLLQTSAFADQSVTFGWDENTDPNIVGYNIYYGTSSQDYTNVVSVGNVTSATISGLQEGVTYYFAATSYDSMDQESVTSPEIVYTVPLTVTQPPPSITTISISNGIVSGQSLTFFVNATGTGPLTYSLAPGAPDGAWIDDTNGEFHWSPDVDQASTINTITVVVTDGSTGLSSTQTFTVVVQDTVSVALGTTVVATNSTGSLPLSIYASTPVNNVQFTFTYPPDQLSGMSITPANAAVSSASITPIAPGQALVNIQTGSGQSLSGLQSVGTINFSSPNNANTTVTYVSADAVNATKPDSTYVAQGLGGLGRATIVGQGTMLEAQSTNGVRNLTIYGPVGAGYTVQSSPVADATGAWSDTPVSVIMSDLTQTVQFSEDGSAATFYRTVRTQ